MKSFPSKSQKCWERLTFLEIEEDTQKVSFSFCVILKWKIFLQTFQIEIWSKCLDFENLSFFLDKMGGAFLTLLTKNKIRFSRQPY